MKTKLKRDLMPNRIKKVKKDLEKKCHDFIRARDSTQSDSIGGPCFDCHRRADNSYFHAGHWEPSSSSGALLRYHPDNIHGQAMQCNLAYQQESVKIAYTIKMLEKYGQQRIDELRALKNKTIKADIIFYATLLDLYTKGVEQDIIDYLESL